MRSSRFEKHREKLSLKSEEGTAEQKGHWYYIQKQEAYSSDEINLIVIN